jgi:hypothetical protein
MFRRINFSVLSRRFSTPAMNSAAREAAADGMGSMGEGLTAARSDSNMKVAGLTLLALTGVYFYNSRRKFRKVRMFIDICFKT